jgi:adenosylcobinamide-GDP ribazoletransferase
MPDWLRLAVGTLSILRVPAPRRVDAGVARGAMLAAPLVGLGLGLLAAAVAAGVRWVAPEGRSPVAVDLLAAVLAIAVLAWSTRALHLDGLADLADGLGVKGSGPQVRERRLAVMREPGAGAFGVVTVVLVLALQTSALTVALLGGLGSVVLVNSVVTGRLAIVWACVRGVPSARPDGLGAAVAGQVPRLAAALVTLLVLGAAVAAATLLDDDGSLRSGLLLAAAMLGGLLAGALTTRHAVRRLGGITGDTLGATTELTTTATLVLAALLV